MIRVLDKSVADKIAAGEVIDRPVSIVKELVENAIDAESGNITVEIRNGGKSYIRVTDDGVGISGEEAALAFSRHATSKIGEEKDLDAIATLGFRGEALASICAVSRVEMITKPADAPAGRRLTVEGSQILRDVPAGCPDGTTITVSDLFYNLPARRKFLASDNGEARRIIDLMSRMALAYPDIRIRLINGKKTVFQTTGKGNIGDNILRIYGKEIREGLIPVDETMGACRLRGFVGSPDHSSSSRNRQIFCVNGRIVSSKDLERGLERAYRERLFTGRFPMAFLFLSVPPETLDVNVHPTKKEIRFDDPFLMEDLVERAAAKALATGGAIPAPKAETVEIPGDREEEPVQTEAEPGKIREKTVISNEKPVDNGSVAREHTPIQREEQPQEQVDIKYLLEDMRKEADSSGPHEMAEEKGEYADVDLKSLDVIGVGLDTYIIASDGEDLFLIDQHAAHERIFYETFLNQYHSEEKYRQAALVPLQYSVSADVEAAEDEWIDQVRAMGYDIEYFGSRTYIVREVPAFMEGEEADRFLRQFFLELADAPDVRQFPTLDKLIIRSCKSAVKGGDRLDRREVDALLDQLAECGNPWSCPHGRPTIVRLRRYELEKMFKRV